MGGMAAAASSGAAGPQTPSPRPRHAAVHMYSEQASMQDLFGDLKGRELFDAMVRAYVVKTGETWHFFDSAGKPLLKRHPLNQRRHAVVANQKNT